MALFKRIETISIGSVYVVGMPLLISFVATFATLLDRLSELADILRILGGIVMGLSVFVMVAVASRKLTLAMVLYVWAAVIHVVAAVQVGLLLYVELAEEPGQMTVENAIGISIPILVSSVIVAAVHYWRIWQGCMANQPDSTPNWVRGMRDGVWCPPAPLGFWFSPAPMSLRERVIYGVAVVLIIGLLLLYRFGAYSNNLSSGALNGAIVCALLILGAAQSIGFAIGLRHSEWHLRRRIVLACS